MTQEVTLSVSWATILLSIIAAFISIGVAAIFKPTIFIARDIVAWRIINRHIFNEATRSDINKLTRYNKRLTTQFKSYGDYMDNGHHITGGWLNGEATQEGYVDIHNATKNVLEEETRNLNINIENKIARLNFIIHHLGMESTENPITQLLNSLSKHYDENPPEDVKVDYDWATDEAVKVTRNEI